MKTRYIFPFVAAALLSSCSTTFEPDIESKQQGVLNVIASADSHVLAYLSTTWRYDHPEQKRFIKDADVTLYVNGVEYGKMIFVDDENTANDEHYECDYVPRVGDRLEVRAATRDFGTLSGMCELPEPVKVEAYEVSTRCYEDHDAMIVVGNEISYATVVEFNYRITFTDPADEENYYMLCSNAFPTDPIFDENQNPIDGLIDSDDFSYYSIFSDRSINGRTYTLQCQTQYYGRYDRRPYDPGQCVDKIYLASISRDYYRYILSILKKDAGLQGELDQIGLGMPMTIFSNIDGGVGIVAAQSLDGFEVDVTDKVNELLKNSTK